MNKSRVKCIPIACIVVLFTVLFALPARADTISYYLDQNNAGLPVNNYLQVTICDGGDVDCDGEAGDIVFQVDVLIGVFPDPGDNFGMDKFFFNFDNSLEVDTDNIDNIDPSSWDVNTDKNAGGGFGKFEFQLKGNGSSRVTTLLFSIVDVDSDIPKHYAVGNPDGNPPASEFFAAHVGDFQGFPTDAESAQFAGSTVVPIPGSVVLLGSGLLGLVAIRRRMKK